MRQQHIRPQEAESQALMRDLIDQFEKLEDPDCQQAVFNALSRSVHTFDHTIAHTFFGLIERSKSDRRISTQRLHVLLLAELCKTHANVAGRLSTRIMTYVFQCLYQQKEELTRACVLLVSYLVLYTPTSIRCKLKTTDEKLQFQANWLLTLFNKFVNSTNTLNEHAIQCVCAVILPVNIYTKALDENAFSAHGIRLARCLSMIIASQTAGSRWKDKATYLDRLASICSLEAVVRLAKKLSILELTSQVIEYIPVILQMVQGVLCHSPRKEWKVRMHCLKLARLLVTIQRETQSVTSATQVELDELRVVVVSSRQDSVAFVREEASETIAIIDSWKEGALEEQERKNAVQVSLQVTRDTQLPHKNLRVLKSDSDPNYQYRSKGVAWCQNTSNSRPEDIHCAVFEECCEGDEAFPELECQNASDTMSTPEQENCDLDLTFEKKERDPNSCTLQKNDIHTVSDRDIDGNCDAFTARMWSVEQIALMEAYGKEDLELAFRLVLLEENTILLQRLLYHLTRVVHPLSMAISIITPITGNALCVALLEILCKKSRTKDYWLIFLYLVEFIANRKAFQYLLNHVRRGVRKRLWRISMETSKEALEAIRLLDLWEEAMAPTK